ncbi:MAG: SDR family oxidoreductase [Chlamydiota bacterium]|nr:SDR family oxidoreductase [Chlamydiota bacterium]
MTDGRSLKGQVALVTGGSSGIGRGVALALAKAGAEVAINYVGAREGADEVADEIEKAGGKAHLFSADVSREEEVLAMFDALCKECGTLDILINNAGIQSDAPLIDMSLEQWNRVIGINLTGQFLCARSAIREFLRRGMRKEVSCDLGKIVCMSSVHQVIPWATHTNYAASKGGIMMMMESMAQEHAQDRIRINAICPGAIRTPINTEAWDTPEAYQKLLKVIPCGRIGEVEDLGKMSSWLVSDEASYIHGASLFIDGGMTLFPGFTTNG